MNKTPEQKALVKDKQSEKRRYRTEEEIGETAMKKRKSGIGYYDRMSPDERLMRGRNKNKGGVEQKRKAVNKRYHRLCKGSPVHAVTVKTHDTVTSVSAWVRGSEGMTIWLMENLYGDYLYTRYRMKNDIYVVRGENDDSSLSSNYSGLKTPTFYAKDGIHKHETDHYLEIKAEDQDDFLTKLAEMFKATTLQELFERDQNYSVVLETKSLRRASKQKPSSYFDSMMSNASIALDSESHLVYFILNWSETSCTLFYANSDGKLTALGWPVVFRRRNTDEKKCVSLHRAATTDVLDVTLIPTPTHYHRSDLTVPAVNIRYVDWISKDKRFITTRGSRHAVTELGRNQFEANVTLDPIQNTPVIKTRGVDPTATN